MTAPRWRVEVAEWRVSSRCLGVGDPPDCVEVGDAGHAVAVRDSADPAGPVLALTPAAWAGLLAAIKEGRDA